MNPRRGKTKHCVFEGCKSDSRYGPTVNFIPFPKACLAVRRKLIEGDKAHLRDCVLCGKCNKWIKFCKRKDGRFNHILHVNEHKYICKKHFVADGPCDVYPVPLPEVEVNKIRDSTPAPELHLIKTEPICIKEEDPLEFEEHMPSTSYSLQSDSQSFLLSGSHTNMPSIAPVSSSQEDGEEEHADTCSSSYEEQKFDPPSNFEDQHLGASPSFQEVTAAIKELGELKEIVLQFKEEFNDENVLFGRHVAMQLRQLPEELRIQAQEEIQRILTRYRLEAARQ